jgi:Tfp pilus assembly protein PilF
MAAIVHLQWILLPFAHGLEGGCRMRRSLVCMGVWALLTGSSGCSSLWVKDTTAVVPAVPPPGEPIAKAKDEAGPKRQPKAITCVKYGEWFESCGSQPQNAGQRAGFFEKARGAYEQALQIDPINQEAFLGLARLYEIWDKPELARTAYQNAVKVLPNEATVWFAYGMWANRRREFDLGAECIRRSCCLEPTNINFSNMLGFTLARGGHADESLAQFKQTVGEARGLYNLARVSHHLGHEEQCRKYLDAALKADPNLKDEDQLAAQLDAPAKAVEDKVATPTEEPPAEENENTEAGTNR